jgi:hypothetical protein
MPEMIWAYGMRGGGSKGLRFWSTYKQPHITRGGSQYVRADIAEARAEIARRDEREVCAQIAQRISDQYLRGMDDQHGAQYHYHDGASDAGAQIADEISSRDQSRSRTGQSPLHGGRCGSNAGRRF